MIRRSSNRVTTSNRVKAKSNRVTNKTMRTAREKRTQAYGDDWDEISKECIRLAGRICAKCGARGNRAHHIVPLSRGGRNIQSNLQCLCEDCHESKHKHLQRRKTK